MPDLRHGDALTVLPTLPDQSIDMVLCDLPYGKTAAKWDRLLPMEVLWREYKRLVKPRGAIVLTAVQPFSSLLVTSNLRWYRHSWVWDKGRGMGLGVHHGPIAYHEDILVFGRSSIAYYPVMSPRRPNQKQQHRRRELTTSSLVGNKMAQGEYRYFVYTETYPTSVLHFPSVGTMNPERIHPTQKPVALFEYLIRTYTQPGQVVLDHCAGSMTTAIAALRTGRASICIERDDEYYTKGLARVEREWRKPVAMTMWEHAS